MENFINKPLNNIIYNLEYIGIKKQIFVFTEIYGNFLFILNENTNIYDFLNKVEIAIIISKKNGILNINYKLNSSIFLTLRNKCDVTTNGLDNLKNKGYLDDGRKYYLYEKALGTIVVIYKDNMDESMDIDEKITLINKLLNNVKISFIVSKMGIKIDNINDLSKYNI